MQLLCCVALSRHFKSQFITLMMQYGMGSVQMAINGLSAVQVLVRTGFSAGFSWTCKMLSQILGGGYVLKKKKSITISCIYMNICGDIFR